MSLFSSDGPAEIPHLSFGRKEDWEVNFPSTLYRIFSKYTANCIPMYEMVFKEMGFRLPFSPFQISLFQWLALSPSQLHPKSYPFIKAFELVYRYLCVSPSKDLYFNVFSVRRDTNRKGGRKWGCFRQNENLFDAFGVCTVDSFKERFFLVRPRTEAALSNVLKTIEGPHVRGGVASTQIPRFNCLWYLNHFEYKPKFYKCKYAHLSSQ